MSEPDSPLNLSLNRCPKCFGVADRGHSNFFFPDPLPCTKCSANYPKEYVAMEGAVGESATGLATVVTTSSVSEMGTPSTNSCEISVVDNFHNILIGGNHLASSLCDIGNPLTIDNYEDALNKHGTLFADMWVAWKAIMAAKNALKQPVPVFRQVSLRDGATAMHSAGYTNDLSERDGFIQEEYLDQARACAEAWGLKYVD